MAISPGLLEREATPQTSTSMAGTDSENHQLGTVDGPYESAQEPVSEAKNAEEQEEAVALRTLAADVRDQDDLERDIGRQADQLLNEQALEQEQKRLVKARSDRQRLANQMHALQVRLGQSAATGLVTAARIQSEVANYQVQVNSLDQDIEEIQERIEKQEAVIQQNGDTEQFGNRRLPHESLREFLIRKGKITPFSRLAARPLARSGSTLQEVLLDAEEGRGNEEETSEEDLPPADAMSHRNLLRPGFNEDFISVSETAVGRPTKRRRLRGSPPVIVDKQDFCEEDSREKESTFSDEDEGDGIFEPSGDDLSTSASGLLDEESDTDEADFKLETHASKRKRTGIKGHLKPTDSGKEDLASLDDGNEKVYQRRLQDWARRRKAARLKIKSKEQQNMAVQEDLDAPSATEPSVNTENVEADAGRPEWQMPHPSFPDKEIDSVYRLPGDIYPSLFDYQKTGVHWLWELYTQQVGGIIGDEMGLGKTIQVISFLAGLHYSEKITRPVIVVTPATVMKQWVSEFHTWWPAFRVSILHASGSGMIDIGRESKEEEKLSERAYSRPKRQRLSKSQEAARKIVDRVVTDGHILVTTYSGLQTYAEFLIPVDWEYAVLDEGHKIRNPNASITIHCKELRTANRIILSGTPMQNNLVELWSLFDFVFPMKLGTLVNFKQQFDIPIRQGGYANASNLQVQTAARCAETLKDSIAPYLLQRFKVDVAADLPKKTEQVLFCKLTKQQRDAYESFLNGDDMKSIINGRRQMLYGIDILRKICNHPDLTEHKTLSVRPGYRYGSSSKSGKMLVVKELLSIWKRGGHKTLLFAQHRIMLDILEKYVQSIDGLKYRRMDGTTPIPSRQTMVDDFNNNPELHVFLLTTKVGGLGVNLTGADRVIIYDPDWNPSTDIQARERAWRLGQKREVQIYRLMTAGTIEEKIYHRQIFKQFLTNKILRDPKQRQTFQLKDLHDLFTLGGANEETTESGRLFEGTETRFGGDLKDVQTQDRVGTAPGCGVASSAPRDMEGHASIKDMAGVASIRALESETSSGAQADLPSGSNSDQRILAGIFARSGVQSALEHDKIINGKRVIAADPRMIEKEARKIAAQAASELRKAEAVARTVPVGTPTWTGQFGTGGRPDHTVVTFSGPGRGAGRGPTSSSILAGLQARQTGNATSATSPAGMAVGTANEQPGSRTKDFTKLIRDYLQAHGGKVYTQMLIDHFNRHCTTPARTAEFKAVLKEIAMLQKGSGGRGAWMLKEEYKQRA